MDTLDVYHLIRTGPYAGRTVRDRFISQVSSDPDGCWHWRGPKFNNGYGRFRCLGGEYLAHRVSFTVFHGREPVGVLLHTCDNRLCVNPNHLIEGTTSDNFHDMWSKGRGNPRRGEDHPRSVLTDEDVVEIRRRRGLGELCREIALDYNVSLTQIIRVCNGTRRVSAKENNKMMPNEYVTLAMRTKKELGQTMNIAHAALLLGSEAGEVMSEVKRHVVYGKALDVHNIKEELGDILWGVALMCDSLGISLEDVMKGNIAKLEARYPDLRFEADHAINRDKEAEREAMAACNGS